MPAWPSSLPCPQANSYGETPPNNLIRSQMDKGPEVVRRRTTANVRPLNFSLMLTPAETQTLDDFYVDDLMSGALAFDYTHPRTGEACRARFSTQPQYRNFSSIKYIASISLEILP